MTDSPSRIVPAYNRKDYPIIRAASKDWMPDTFDKWCQGFNERERAEQISGALKRTPYIRVNARKLRAWLANNNLVSTDETRAQYAGALQAERIQLGKGKLAKQPVTSDRPYDPAMPLWANKLQAHLSDWWTRYGLW